MFHAISPRHLMSQHITSDHPILHLTSHHSLPPTTISHHHISKHNIFHITQPQSTSRHSTPTTIPHHSHLQHHSTFHTTPYSTLHYTTTSWFYITPPHLTSQHIASFPTSDITQHIAYAAFHHHNSTPPHFTSRNFPHLALCNVPHTRTPQSTPCHIPHHTFAFQSHFTLHHVWKSNIPHHIAFHTSHFTVHHNFTLNHLAPIPHHTHILLHTMHITTFKYKLHITHSKPHHTSHTAFQPSFHITPCLIWHQTIPHHSVFHNHISHLASRHTNTFPMHPTTIPHRITHFTPDIARHHSIIPCRTYSTSHLIPHHSHIRMNKAQHPTSGTAKCCTSHQIPHYSTPCDLVVLKCGMVCCTVVVICGMYSTLPLHLAPHYIIPPHFTLHHSTSNAISDIFQTTPHSMSHHHSSPYHTFRITPTPLAACYATLQYHISNCSHICITPHLTSHFTLHST